MNKPLFFASCIFLIISLIVTKKAVLEYKIYESKRTVLVKILELPDCNNSRRHQYLTFEYENSKIILRVKCKYIINFQVGQLVTVYHKEGSDVFALLDQDVEFELRSGLLLNLIGLVILVISLRRKK